MYAENVICRSTACTLLCLPRKEQRGLLAKGKELFSLSFQSKNGLDVFIALNSLEHLVGM